MVIPDSSMATGPITLTHFRFLRLVGETLITRITGSCAVVNSQMNWWGTAGQYALNEPLMLAVNTETRRILNRARRQALLAALTPEEREARRQKHLVDYMTPQHQQ